jgi:hypothetical protein
LPFKRLPNKPLTFTSLPCEQCSQRRRWIQAGSTQSGLAPHLFLHLLFHPALRREEDLLLPAGITFGFQSVRFSQSCWAEKGAREEEDARLQLKQKLFQEKCDRSCGDGGDD